MHILFLSRWFPHPADNGSKLRIAGLLKELARRHDVTLLCFGSPAEVRNQAAVSELQQYCTSVQAFPYHGFRPSSPRALAGLLSVQPRSFVDTFSRDMSRAVAEAVGRRRFDLVIATQFDMVPYALGVPGVPLLLEELELSVMQEAISRSTSIIRRLRAGLAWFKLRTYLAHVLPRFVACTVASDRERANVLRIFPEPARVHVVPNAVDLSQYARIVDPPRRDTLVFSGSPTYSANRDAVMHLLGDILPLIRAQHDSVRLRITGQTTGVDLTQFPSLPQVEWTGYLADVRPAIAESWASVVPIRLGGGTRLKILEAMALGTPVVSTSKGAEGLAVTPGENILLADEPHAFAASTIRLLQSPELRARLAMGGRRLVESRYDARQVGRELCSLVERLHAQEAACG